MPKYRVPTSIAAASGTQWWIVEADSPEEACEKQKRGECDFEDEEIEITELHDPRPGDCEEIEEE